MTRGGSIAVREASSEDLERFLDLYLEFYGELRSKQGWRPHGWEEYREEVERFLLRDKVFLAETNSGETVGFIRVSEREDSYWIEELYVKPGYRGRGVGRRLLEEAETFIREHDSYAYIMVLPQDRRAMSFWLHMGYHILNSVELAKDLEGTRIATRPIPLLSNILEMYQWAREDYTPLEKRFLELVEEFQRRGGNGEELLEIFVKALQQHLVNNVGNQ